MKMTSATANKKLREIQDRHDFLVHQMEQRSTYIISQGEDPASADIPEFSLAESESEIAETEKAIVALKHAINEHNMKTSVDCGSLGSMTIDAALVKMSLLTKQKNRLDEMRKCLPRERVMSYRSSSVPEWKIVNYDIKDAEARYNDASRKLSELQTALDVSNNTETLEIEIEYC